MECTERMGNVQGARRRHLAGEERGIYPIRLRAFGQGVFSLDAKSEAGLAYPDRDLRLGESPPMCCGHRWVRACEAQVKREGAT